MKNPYLTTEDAKRPQYFPKSSSRNEVRERI